MSTHLETDASHVFSTLVSTSPSFVRGNFQLWGSLFCPAWSVFSMERGSQVRLDRRYSFVLLKETLSDL